LAASSRSGLRASKWANPFMIERDGAREEVIATYERCFAASALI
jgi:hypothetical protein